MRVKIILLALAFAPFAAFSADRKGYFELPNAEERETSRNFIMVPNFPRLEIVKEGEGTPNPELANVITDPELQKQIVDGKFTSLQVRDLSIARYPMCWEGNVLRLNYIASLKHGHGTGVFRPFNLRQGTIEVAGVLVIQVANDDSLKVSVLKYYDSQWLERVGRFLGFQDAIDLKFASNIVSPILEHYFNSNPDRIKQLLLSVQGTSAPGEVCAHH